MTSAHATRSRLSHMIVRLMSLAMLVVTPIVLPLSAAASPSCDPGGTMCQVDSLLTLQTTLGTFTSPSVPTPAWMKPHTTFTYAVQTRGVITADIAEFKALANQTLNDSRGWSRLDVRFIEVPSGGSFTLYLSEAAQMTSFSAGGCSTVYSCTVGNNIIINQERWQEATPSWNAASGSLRDYRHMVVNHETGHWLGHNHQHCTGVGQSASVMQQQSIDLEGCSFNPWPLDSELWSTRL